ncbi:hypothetical protein BN2537_12401 [Streptomyces venezuelae]|nr:hypothetical protein BN2537_12401 [Streptomyces venezuelae]
MSRWSGGFGAWGERPGQVYAVGPDGGCTGRGDAATRACPALTP